MGEDDRKTVECDIYIEVMGCVSFVAWAVMGGRSESHMNLYLHY